MDEQEDMDQNDEIDENAVYQGGQQDNQQYAVEGVQMQHDEEGASQDED
jgi:hypothetical protein